MCVCMSVNTFITFLRHLRTTCTCTKIHVHKNKRTDKADTLRSLGLGGATGGLPSDLLLSSGMGGACLTGGLV